MVLGAGAGTFFVPTDVGNLQSGAVATRAPAVLRVIRKQARIELGKAAPAGGAGALGREHPLDLRLAIHDSVHRCDDVHHTLAVFECALERLAQHVLPVRKDVDIRHRQLDGVLLESVDARERAHRQELPIHPQMGMALGAGPFRQVGVDALAVHHQRRKQADARSPILSHQSCGDRLLALRLDRHLAVGAMLHAQFHEQQPQEMMDLGQRAHRALAPPAAGTLLDRDRRRNAAHRIHVRTRSRLHELPGVCVQRFEVAALPFGEDDVESERGLAAAGHAGHHGETLARNRQIDVLQVVLAGIMDMDGARREAGGGRRRLRGGLGSLPDHPLPQRPFVCGQRKAGVRPRITRYLFRGATANDFPAGVATLGTEVHDPVGGADHVEVVLDHHQRVAGCRQLAQGAQQLGHVLEVQAGGGLVE